MPSQIDKLEAHASHLLDAFIGLREKYALLEPMLFDRGLNERRGATQQARGFLILRHTLFLSCAQDIAKLCMDADDRTPSIRNIVASLSDRVLLQDLENRYAIWVLPSVETETDPDIVAALKRVEEQERLERRAQFREHYREIQAGWQCLSDASPTKGFSKVRDRISAHTEVRFVADKYQLVDLKSLGIKWGDLRQTIEAMERLVELIGLIVRNAGFAWDSLSLQLGQAAAGFWGVDDEAR